MVPNLRFQIVGIDPDPHSIYPRLKIQVNVHAENVGQKDTYTLTDKGSKWVNPESILETESEIGSDLHKQLLVKTISHIQLSFL